MIQSNITHCDFCMGKKKILVLIFAALSVCFVIGTDEYPGKHRRSGFIHGNYLDCGPSRLGADAGRCRLGHHRIGIAF